MRVVAACIALLLVAAASSSAALALTVSEVEGETVKVDLGYNIFINDGSSLTRRWFTLHDAGMPASLDRVSGVTVVYEKGRSVSDLYYMANYSLSARSKITAYEIRYLTFDVFGNAMRTLSTTTMRDVEAGAKFVDNSKWRMYDDSEASRFHTSISFLAQVRAADGTVTRANLDAVLAEARKISSKVTAADLESKPAKE